MPPKAKIKRKEVKNIKNSKEKSPPFLTNKEGQHRAHNVIDFRI